MMRFLLLILLYCPSLLPAQSLRFTHFDTRQGLSQNSVHALLQDREGFIWMGTQEGLSRFDGYAFTVYRHSIKDTASLPDNFVIDLAEDVHGNIWIGTRSGLCVFQKSKNRFLRYYSGSKTRQLHSNAMYMLQCGNGIIASISQLGMCEVELQGDKITAKPFQKKAMRVWDGHHKFLIREADTLFTAAAIHAPRKPYHVLASGLRSDISGIVCTANETYAGSLKILYRISSPDQVEKIAEFPENIVCLTTDHAGRIWVGTDNGLWVYQPETKSLIAVKTDAANPFSLSSGMILSLMCDRQGVMWVGTSGGGVNICDTRSEFFKVYNSTHVPDFPPGAVWCAAEIQNSVLLGTEKGVIIIPDHTQANPPWFSLIPSDVFATYLCFDKQGKLWIGTRNNGIISIDTALQKKEWIDTTNSSLSDNGIFHISSPSDTEIVICTRRGLNFYNPLTGVWRVYTTQEQLPTINGKYFIQSFTDRQNVLWLAHPMGLTRYSKNSFYTYRSLPDDTSSLPFDVVSFVSEGSGNSLWVSTLGGGVAHFLRAQNRFVTYNTALGLPNDVVYAALEDKQGKLWMSTNEGLCRLDPQTGFAEVFTTRDGLPSNEFVQNAALLMHNGHIGFGSVDGWVSFDPAAHNTLADTLQPVLSGLFVNNQPVPYFELRELLLDHQSRNVSFAFTAVCYRVQEKIRYSCMLEGFDQTWIEQAPGQRMISYTNLPFGEYVFKVRVRVGNGPWQQQELRLPLRVVPPFWMQTWFYILMGVLAALLLAGVVAWIARQKYRRRMRVLETEHKIHIERERISRDLHDNIGAQITYIVSTLDFLSFRLDKQTPVENRQLIQELGLNARQTMDQLRETIWAMNQPALGLEEFVQKLRNFAQRAGSSASMHIQIDHQENAPGITLASAQVLHLYRIIQEAVNNALKHAQASHLSISFTHEHKTLLIVIRDNGCGFNEKQNHEGHYGLANIRTRAAEIGATVDIHSQPNKGVSITVRLPFVANE
jgi:signal transduction histidine kinase/ligand-binding sensor domain-containing protein